MHTTRSVINNHLQRFAERDVEGLLSDYAPGAVLFTPNGPLGGLDAIRPFFEGLTAEFAKPGSTFELEHLSVDGGHGYIVWNAATADNVYEVATDTFFVRDGKIEVQSFAGKITPRQ